jgi:hypothetical protein
MLNKNTLLWNTEYANGYVTTQFDMVTNKID